MRIPRSRPTLSVSLAVLLASPQVSQAAVAYYSKISQVTISAKLDATTLQNKTLDRRGNQGCANPCGWYGQVCCQADQVCYTDSQNRAACSPQGWAPAPQTVQATGAGSWEYWTSTFVGTETDLTTYTTVYSTWVPASTAQPTTWVQTTWAPAPVPSAVEQTCVPNPALAETACGPICCASSQYCFHTGTCTSFGQFTTAGVIASAPARGTTVTGVVITSTVSPTTTVPFSTPTPESSGNGTVIAPSSPSKLSGGAIAGIVIGVIAAIIILLLICLFCCLKAGFDSIVALFGGGRRNRRKSRVVEEEIIEHRRHGSAAASANGRRWYGSGYDRPSRPPPSRRSSQRRNGGGGFGGLAAVTAGLGGLALALGMKRKADRRRKEEEKASTVSYSYYDSSYYDSSTSSGGSDDRTRRTSRIIRERERSRSRR